MLCDTAHTYYKAAVDGATARCVSCKEDLLYIYSLPIFASSALTILMCTALAINAYAKYSKRGSAVIGRLQRLSTSSTLASLGLSAKVCPHARTSLLAPLSSTRPRLARCYAMWLTVCVTLPQVRILYGFCIQTRPRTLVFPSCMPPFCSTRLSKDQRSSPLEERRGDL